MTKKGTTWARGGFAAISLMLVNALHAQTQVLISPTENPLPESTASTPNSKPTLEQIEKGRSLLAKLVNILEVIPFTDADSIMAEFGIKDVDYEVYPTQIRVTAKDRMDLPPLGLISLSVRPWEGGELPNFNSTVDVGACIQKKDIDGLFGTPFKSSVKVLIDRGPPDLDFYPSYFYYKIPKTSLPEYAAEVSFGFYSRLCVESFGVGYSFK